MNRLNSAAGSYSRFWEAAAVLWTAVVLSFAISPIRNVELLTASLSDKLLHAIAFVLGSVVWAGALDRDNGPWRAALLASAICLGMGGIIEIIQSRTVSRQAEAGDLIADTAGIVLGVLVWVVVSHRISNRLSSPEKSM